MSYDIVIFDPSLAPHDNEEFLSWIKEELQWRDDIDYNDPDNLSPELKSFFDRVRSAYPPMNGPHALDMEEISAETTDYSLGSAFIYCSCAWSISQKAYKYFQSNVRRHGLGFYQISGVMDFDDDVIERFEKPPELEGLENGLEIAQQRIAACKSSKSESLDLGGLAFELTANHELWEDIAELSWLKELYLGVSKEARKIIYRNASKEARSDYKDEDEDESFINLYSERTKSTVVPVLNENLFEKLTRLEVLDIALGELVLLPQNLSNAKKLRRITLHDNPISDLSPLEGLSNLEYLCLHSTDAQDLTPLASLTSLKELDLSETPASLKGGLIDDAPAADLRPISSLKNLLELNLYRVYLNDLGPLAELSNLQKLNLSYTLIEDISPLGLLKSLRILYLSDNRNLKDLSPLAGAKQLEELIISSPGKTIEFSALSDLPALKKIYILNARERNIKGIGKLKALEEVRLYSDVLYDISAMKGSSSLKIVDLTDTGIKSLDGLADSHSLNRLNIAGTSVADLEPLRNMRQLQYLDAKKTRVTDLSPLEDANVLLELNLDDTRIKDISSLEGIRPLRNLQLNDTKISDLSPLQSLTNLEELSCARTDVSDLRPLSEMKKLRSLGLYWTNVEDLSPLFELTSLEDLIIERICTNRNLEPIWKLHNLKSLYLSNVTNDEMELIATLPNIETLSLGDSEITSLTPLKALKNLKKLYVGECKFYSDCEEFWAHPSLENVEFLRTFLPNVPRSVTKDCFFVLQNLRDFFKNRTQSEKEDAELYIMKLLERKERPKAKKKKGIAGNWDLTSRDFPNAYPVGNITLGLEGETLFVCGRYWKGKGQFDGKKGYYDWKNYDGQKGRTEFYLGDDGNIYGDVTNFDDPDDNWQYIGTRK